MIYIQENLRMYLSFVYVLIYPLLAFFCVSCSSSTSIELTAKYMLTQPAPTPEFIAEAASHGLFGDEICISINTEVIWESGMEANTLPNHIFSDLIFIIDGEEITEVMGSTLATVVPIIDGEQNIVGTHAGVITSCANTEDLSRGLHIGHIAFSHLSGKQYEYNWAFRLDEIQTQFNDPEILPMSTQLFELLPTPSTTSE